jgi:hypothetical protein
VEVPVEDREVVEKRTTVTREDRVDQVEEPKTTNVNVGPDGSTDVQEDTEMVEDPVGSTIIRQEETIEKHQR